MLKQHKIRDVKHLAGLRDLPCLKCGFTPCDPAHIRIGSQAGTGQKPGDDCAVPLCHAHHAEQHTRGERTFWSTSLFAARQLARDLYEARSQYGVRMRLCREFRFEHFGVTQ